MVCIHFPHADVTRIWEESPPQCEEDFCASLAHSRRASQGYRGECGMWSFFHPGRQRFRNASRDQAVTQSLGDGFRFRVHLQLLVDVLDMKSHRVEAHAQFRGGRFIVVSFH